MNEKLKSFIHQTTVHTSTWQTNTNENKIKNTLPLINWPA